MSDLFDVIRPAFYEGVRFGRAAESKAFWDEVKDDDDAWLEYKASVSSEVSDE